MTGTAGSTLDQMRSTLGFGSRPLSEVSRSYRELIDLLRTLNPRVDFRLANALFHRESFQAVDGVLPRPGRQPAGHPRGAPEDGLTLQRIVSVARAGARRARVACSRSYAKASSAASLQGSPMNATTKGMPSA